MKVAQFRGRVVVGVFALAALAAAPAVRAQGVRMNDKDVKAVAEAIDKHADKFRDALDDQFKTAILRGPGGEVNIKKFLDDFEQSIERMRERVKPEYAASTEVQAVLRQASTIDAYVKTQPAGAKGASEWGQLASDLSQIASAYGTSFPLPDGAPVRRIGDKETIGALDGIIRDALRIKNSIGKEKATDKAKREAIKVQADTLAAAAKTLKSRVSDRKPAASEAEAVLNAGDALVLSFSGAGIGPATTTALASLTPDLDKVAQSFGVSR